ncbi:MAG: YigZ family protein [candidate division Zixibacteria bacterium]|nr:YigZ family protein [candidate division Zixibacteria bacterium]
MAKSPATDKSDGNPPSDEYRTVSEPARAEIKVKGSRFIGSVESVRSVEDAEEFIGRISSEFHDATHNCFAYKVGIGKEIKNRYSDQGEPSGTAGSTIMNSIESSGLTNVAIVITRYFGGTKLGTGNLARAYAAAADEVLCQCKTVTRILFSEISLSVPADMVSSVYHLAGNFYARVTEEIYSPDANFKLQIRLSYIERFKRALTESTNGKVEFYN